LPSNAARTVVAAPMSLAGSTGRTLNLLWHDRPPGVKFGIGLWAIPMILTSWWVAIAFWYVFFGIFLIPYRLLRRGSRKRKREARMHSETLKAIRDASSGGQPPVN